MDVVFVPGPSEYSSFFFVHSLLLFCASDRSSVVQTCPPALCIWCVYVCVDLYESELDRTCSCVRGIVDDEKTRIRGQEVDCAGLQ